MVRAIAARGLAGVEAHELGDDTTALLDWCRGASSLIVIDAVVSVPPQPPGTVHRLDASRAAVPATWSATSTHGLGIGRMLELARTMGCLPPEGWVFGIEAAACETGEAVSAAVSAAMQVVEDDIVQLARGDAEDVVARRLLLRGAVQGVGFRPYVYRLAHAHAVNGSVRNTTAGVEIHVEGPRGRIDAFLRALPREAPPAAEIQSCDVRATAPLGLTDFGVAPSVASAAARGRVHPDLVVCGDCLREMHDPADRRFGYPFLTCTNCGPRLSIVDGLPYDRARTTMRGFPLCPECAREYHDPGNRRFHAEPVACPACGPQLLWDGPREGRGTALEQTAACLRDGGIVALQGLGGYQLLADARSEAAVTRLRARKQRGDKPFAVMFGDRAILGQYATVAAEADAALSSSAAPIVLVPLHDDAPLADAVAPGMRTVGAMLPSTPLHQLLLEVFGGPLVCTSGNLADEPMARTAEDARARLGGIADAFLHHTRPIARVVDDSVVRPIAGAPVVLRRARGYAPSPIPLRGALPTVRALGGHQKVTVAWTHGDEVVASQHLGDMDTPRARRALADTVRDFEALYHLAPQAVVCDLHPDYATTAMARESGLDVIAVQHHHAHVVSLLAEHDLDGDILGVAWDGTGYGLDGTIWGGEFLHASRDRMERRAHLRSFALPGGEAASRAPWRSALGVLAAVYGDAMWNLDCAPVRHARARRSVLARMLETGVGTVTTTSAGRLFDAVASLLDLRQDTSYEAEAAMALEQAVRRGVRTELLPIGFDAAPLSLDWRPTIAALLDERRRGAEPADLAARFHRTLARAIADMATVLGASRVGLTGGCFQNAVLTEWTCEELRGRHIEVVTHREVPPNDGGLSIGQALIGATQLAARAEG